MLLMIPSKMRIQWLYELLQTRFEMTSAWIRRSCPLQMACNWRSNCDKFLFKMATYYLTIECFEQIMAAARSSLRPFKFAMQCLDAPRPDQCHVPWRQLCLLKHYNTFSLKYYV